MPAVKLFANLCKLAGIKETSITGASAAEIVHELVKRYPALSEPLLDNGQIRPYVIITINGHPALDFDAPITEQDEVAIFPPITGG